MTAGAIQDYYPEEFSHCYGCGYGNDAGLKLKSYWDGRRATAEFTPAARYTALPGYVYGGLIASLMDCHGTATAAAAAHEAAGIEAGTSPLLRYVTASLKVDYRAPTPLGETLRLTGEATEVGARKVIVELRLEAAGRTCAIGRVVAVQLPESMAGKLEPVS